ncbi:MAG: tetratricopeptide repeat protein [Armatimonadetes bacterium]|nr:tetratricopeptide repeat protein [Armatimonadota bacterium]
MCYLLVSLIMMGATGEAAPASVRTGPQTYIVAVGVEQYDDANIAPLKFAVADAKAVAESFRAAEVPADNVAVLTSDQPEYRLKPTKSNVLAALGRYRGKAVPGDTLVVFFSGHGMQKGAEAYLLTVDSNRELLEDSALAVNSLNKILDGFQGSSILFLIDACRNDPDAGKASVDAALAEEFAKGVRPRLVRPAAAKPANLGAILSCDVGQRAWEMPEERHGAFTYFLLRGLAGAARDPDGNVRMNGLSTYLQREVPAWALRQHRVQQPRPNLAQGDDFVVVPKPDLVNKAYELLNNGKYEQAETVARAAVAATPDEPGGHAALAAALCFRGSPAQYAEAEREAREALRISEQYCDAHISLSRTLERRGDLEGAEAELQRAVELRPESTTVRGWLGSFYLNHQRLAEAVAEYRRIVDLEPTDWGGHRDLGLCLERQKRFDEAEEELRKAVELAQGDPGARPLLPGFLVRQGRHLEGASEYRQWADADPAASDPHIGLARCYEALKRTAEAEAEFRKAAEVEPKLWQPLDWLSLFLFRQQRYQDAIAEIQKWCELTPREWRAHDRLADCYRLTKRYAEAEAECWRASELDPRNPTPQNRLGNVFWDQERYADAEAAYRRAIKLDPKDATMHANLAGALLRQDRRDEAVKEAQESIRLGKPDHWVFGALDLAP